METLLLELKNHLDITFDDEQYDKKLLNQLQMGMSYLRKRIAHDVDFNSDSYIKQLLFEYVRYSLAGAVNDFRDNYASDLLSLKEYEDIIYYANKNE